ncbi:MAG TPA: hypothetical protein VHL79_01060 [Ramlibacter sp.]|jgi:hypothetical protein|nr:hypothetical protein [Ramlibacter sp.]
MTDRTVVPFRLKAQSAAEATVTRGSGSLTWSVAQLPTEQQCRTWLDHALANTPYENTARSLWRHHPNLRTSTEKLASYITPLWPAPGGDPLLQLAVERAVRRAHTEIERGQAFEGRLVGVYLYGLLDVVDDVALLLVRGQDHGGQIRRWEYFSEPLLLWARRQGIEEVILERVPEQPSEAVLCGLRTHMTACLTSPLDAGYLARHAAQG